jgi:hypothetical protein
VDVAGIKVAIWEALNSASISIVGLVGPWGVGKTHLWKAIVEERRADIALKYPRYAYVSLFGLRSISDVKTSILLEVSGTAKLGGNSDAIVSKVWAAAKKKKAALVRRIQKGAAGLGLLGKVAAEAIQLGIDAFEFGAIRNCLVCLDDLERMALELSAIEVMGLVETLARERACKVVLIFSRDNLSDDSKKSLKQYREKIFDREILLDPPMAYAVDIAVQGRDAATVTSLSKVAESLGIKSVRVLKKIITGYDDVLSHLPQLLPPVKNALMFSLGVLYYCHLIGGEDVPTVDNVLAIEYVSPIEEADNGEQNTSTKHLQFLRRAGWTHLSDSDRHLAAYVRDGVCDWAALVAVMEAENRDVASSQRRDEIGELWREYRSSFRDAEGWHAFAERLLQKHLEHISLVNTHSLDSALWVLRKAGMGEAADRLLENWRVAHAHEKQMFDLNELETFQKLTDARLRQVCEQEYVPSSEKDKDILEILARISTEKSWGGDDTAFLESARAEDYASAFRSKKLNLAALDGAQFFLRLANPGAADLIIRAKIEAALRDISHESEINREKVRALGVNLDDHGPPVGAQ